MTVPSHPASRATRGYRGFDEARMIGLVVRSPVDAGGEERKACGRVGENGLGVGGRGCDRSMVAKGGGATDCVTGGCGTGLERLG